MKPFLASLLALGLISFSPQQNGQPINAMCPVKPNQKVKADNVVTYKGQVIGFC
jgi:hypothetical protein